MSHTTGHLLRRAARSLWQNLSLNLVAAGVIAASILLASVYLSVMRNLARNLDTWNRDVHVSAYFSPGVTVERRFAVKDDIGRLEQVESVHYVSEDEARAWLVERVPEVSDILEELGPSALPASLEITLRPAYTTPEEIAAFASRIEGPDIELVDYGQEWVQRFDAFLSLLQAMGAAVGVLICAAAVFLVANAVHLVVYSRRAELETMKLVGATRWFVLVPFLIEGVVQGVAGASAGIAGAWTIHHMVFQRLQAVLHVAMGGSSLVFLPAWWCAVLVLVGALLGSAGAFLSVRRFWRVAP